MLYQLRKLSSAEQEIMLKAPVWVSLLVACADQHIHDKEIEAAKRIVHTKTFSETSDVKNLYDELDHNIDATIDGEVAAMPADPQARLTHFSSKLSQLNDILPKLEHTYALQFYKSLKSLALHIARSEGGVLGIGRISEEEEPFLELDMINKP